MTPAETDELFKRIKNEVRKIDGVSGCGGNLAFPERKIVVYLIKDTKEVMESVEQIVETLINRRISKFEIEWIRTGEIEAGS